MKQLAEQEHRSMNATIAVVVEEYTATRSDRVRVRDPAREVVERDAELLRRLAE
ncbi:Arc family DNA-binding protein [Micromonospora sp. NPDC006766]|uniref:Arc family DNA-binding protein n=1 Tax=Micromonospora sp. NPDC006766 TaxID=3154778 RepID=UPI0033FDC2AB